MNVATSVLQPTKTTTVDGTIEIRHLWHELRNGQSGETYVVTAQRITIPRGKITLVKGPSGTGKTTLLQLFGLAAPPHCSGTGSSVGSFLLRQSGLTWDVPQLWRSVGGRQRLQQLRRRAFGFCLQRGELIPTLTVFDNVAEPLYLNGWPGRSVTARVKNVLQALSSDATNLWTKRDSCPGQLSGGQYQRVALARALIHRPHIVLLDEPTSSIDRWTCAQAIELLREIQRDTGLTLVIVSHDEAAFLPFAEFAIEMSSPKPGIGTVSGYQRRYQDQWIATDSQWESLTRQSEP